MESCLLRRRFNELLDLWLVVSRTMGAAQSAAAAFMGRLKDYGQARYGLTLELWRCADCGLIYADGDEVAELVALYEQIEDQGYQDTQDARILEMRWLVEPSLQEAPKARTLLDIGAGTGLWSIKLSSMDCPQSAWSQATSWLRLNGKSSGSICCRGRNSPGIGRPGFDLVFLVDVIEHVSDPMELNVGAGAWNSKERICTRQLGPYLLQANYSLPPSWQAIVSGFCIVLLFEPL